MEVETTAVLNHLRLLSLSDKEREEMIRKALPLIDRLIETEREHSFYSEFFWKDLREILVKTKEVITSPAIGEYWLGERIKIVDEIISSKG